MTDKPKAIINPKELPSVPVNSRSALPTSSGIYFVATTTGNILYVGKAKNIAKRWIGHHRLPEIIKRHDVMIHYLEAPVELIDHLETQWIKSLKPPMNGSIPDEIVANVARTRSLRFTDTQWDALKSEAKRRGYNSPSAMLQAIADGDLPIGLEQPKINTYAERLARLEGEFVGVWDAIEELRRHMAGLPPLTPTDLP
jgi:hypothetical protein